MAKRGRPSNKTLKKRREARKKCIRTLTIAMVILFILSFVVFYFFFNQGV